MIANKGVANKLTKTHNAAFRFLRLAMTVTKIYIPTHMPMANTPMSNPITIVSPETANKSSEK